MDSGLSNENVKILALHNGNSYEKEEEKKNNSKKTPKKTNDKYAHLI